MIHGNEGIQFQVSTDIENHSITFGYRDLEDYESRDQGYECFQQRSNRTNSALYVCGSGFTGSNNRLRETEATSYFLQDTISMDKLTLTLGYRSEEYDKDENRWKDGVSGSRKMTDPKYINKTSTGDYSTFGIGATYDMNENLSGRLPPRMSPVFGDAEEADNMN